MIVVKKISCCYVIFDCLSLGNMTETEVLEKNTESVVIEDVKIEPNKIQPILGKYSFIAKY